ncbi:MAG: pectate lyase precursor [Myxococcales bacterium]|nr:pectate lyase precursor [Myxococcales bacterium]
MGLLSGGLLLATAGAALALPAFPGAKGFGAAASGGRGGRVIKVTTLASSGPGSLQAALAQSGPRVIVFAVSGIIEGDHTIEHGDVTIAGQTAPGGGITIRGRLFGAYDFGVGNIIIRHVRVRPPPLTPSDGGGDQYDGIQLSRNSRFILDHVSVSWGSDETVDFYEAREATIQWSTIEESGLYGHSEGEHNYGLINGPGGGLISVDHNLFAHHRNRAPALAVGPAEVTNNLIYDTRNGFVHHNAAAGDFNIVGNYYREGPSADIFPFYFDDESSEARASYYLHGNYIDDPDELQDYVDNPWTDGGHSTFEDMLGDGAWVDSPFDFTTETPGYASYRLDSAEEAYQRVLQFAGAFPRDIITRRTLTEVHERGGAWGAEVPSDMLEGLSPDEPPPDSDDDGMPDAWEAEQGLDPNTDDSANELPSGYTAIEEYINGRADAITGAPPDPGGGNSGEGGNGGSGSAGNAMGGNAQSGGSSALCRTDPQGNCIGGSGSDSGDCACSAPGSEHSPSRSPWLLGLALGLAWVRRKRR